MISVPCISDCLPSAFTSSRQVKWQFGCEGLPLAMFIQIEAIDPQFCGVCRCDSSLLSCGGTTTMAHRRDPFDDPEGLISL